MSDQRNPVSQEPSQADTIHLPASDSDSPPSTGSGSSAAQDAQGEAPVVPGQHLGRYRILDLLGAGGMGSVYRALDATLGREVAIKGLAQAFRGDSGSLRRFEREARVLATLSHANIAAIYGFERLNGSPYLVLERIEGETLAQRLARGPMPIDEALPVATQIIAGLEEAHAKGVIHRDLKPSNVMLTPGRHVKLVDFGLAKTAAAKPDGNEVDEPITAVGMVLGTARYMSPEQVKGEELDTRTDVWAFGCVLYEMLTAKPVFAGRSVSEVVAAVLRDEPDWSAIPADVPPAVTRLIRRCLRRDPRMRLQHIGDARVELLDVENDVGTESRANTLVTSASRKHIWIAAALVSAVVVGALFVLRETPRESIPPVRLSVELPARVTLGNEYSAPFAIAPSASLLAVEAVEGGTRRLFLRDLNDPALRMLAGTDGGRQPFFSPDGQWVGFFSDRKLAKVPVGGGPVLEIADVGGNPRGAVWTAGGEIVFAAPQTSGLRRVSDRGGRPAPLTKLDTTRGESSHRWPDALPGGRWVLFTVGFEDASYDAGRIEAVSLETGERRLLLSGAGFARYLPDGQLLFVRGGRLFAVAFDPERLILRGTPEVVLDAVRYDWRNGGSHLAVSNSGVVIYGPGEPSSPDFFLSWVDRAGGFTRAVDAPRPFRDLKRSPDGQRIAMVLGSAIESDLWSVDANATLSRLSFGLTPHRPTWTADGSGITLGAQKDTGWQLLTLPARGAGDPTLLVESANRIYPNAWSPDGRHLIYQESRSDTGWDLLSVEVNASGRPVDRARPFAASPSHEMCAAISPDGRWLAYESDELDGVVQIYVRSWPDGANKVQASTGGARWPTWGRNGELYYWRTGEDTLQMVRTRESGGQLTVGATEPVWRSDVASAVLRRAVISVAGARFDVDARGERVLVLEKDIPTAEPTLRDPIVVFGLVDPRQREAARRAR